jgi:hypothetical protein
MTAAFGINSVLPKAASRQMTGSLEWLIPPACRHTPAAPFDEQPIGPDR